jgi:hypothetical protein
VTSIRDIAKKLNISVSAVSHALNGYPDISEETRRLVIQTAREMGYTPNEAARQLRSKKAGAIGYILPADQPRFADPCGANNKASVPGRGGRPIRLRRPLAAGFVRAHRPQVYFSTVGEQETLWEASSFHHRRERRARALGPVEWLYEMTCFSSG